MKHQDSRRWLYPSSRILKCLEIHLAIFAALALRCGIGDIRGASDQLDGLTASALKENVDRFALHCCITSSGSHLAFTK